MRYTVRSLAMVVATLVSGVCLADAKQGNAAAQMTDKRQSVTADAPQASRAQVGAVSTDVTMSSQSQLDALSHTFTVTVAEKDQRHPYFGSGDRNGFVIDGDQGKELILIRGVEYRFIIKSTPMHDVYISSNEDGWGAEVIESGVKGNFTYDGVLTFTPGEATPDVVYYQCQNHKAMGSRMFVVNPGESLTLAELHARHGIPEVLREAVAEVTEDEVKQKLSYASMVITSKPARRVRESRDEQAKGMLDEATGLIKRARELSADGKQGEAMALVDEALRKVSAASQRVPSEEVYAEQRTRYEGLIRSVAGLRNTHREKLAWVVKQQGPAKAVHYDNRQVDELVRQANQAAERGDYRVAVNKLLEAEKQVTTAMNQMLDAQTMVYKLNLDTPEGEYSYERERYLGYAELVPVALQQRQPDAGQRHLFDGYVNKASAMYLDAMKYGERKEYPDAIKLLQEASAQLLRGLRLLGVNQ